MAHVWRCLNAHQWTDVTTARPGPSARCPVCGAEAHILLAAAVGVAETLAPPPRDENATLAPPAKNFDASETLPPPRADAYGETIAPPAKPGGAFDETIAPPKLPAAPHETLAPTTPTLPAAKRETSWPEITGYEILGVLGRGGMGVVYKARQRGLNRLVALKMVLSGGHAGPDDILRFRVEAEAAARLQHPNIAQVFDIGDHNGQPYFSLEYVDGGSLAGRLDGTPLPARLGAEIVEPLARAMQYAHERGIVHRDLKPANVLVGRDFDIGPRRDQASRVTSTRTLTQLPLKITDFGLAKRMDDDTNLTGTGAILGTPAYMAPEQAMGDPVGPPADVYALGAILYECLTGRPPFRGATAIDTIMQVRNLDPVPPRRIVPDISADLETVCLKCLQKLPTRRYATCGELADDLRRALDGQPILARPITPVERLVKWVQRDPSTAALVGTIALVILSLGFGGVAYAGRERKRAAELDKQRAEAVDARAVAVKAEDLAYNRAREAERERERAEGNFQHAWNAVDQLLLNVGEARLEREPRAEKLRRDLVEAALKFLDRFLKERGGDRVVRQESARAWLAAGRCREMLGQRAEAADAYREACQRFNSLATDFGNAPELRRSEASAQRALLIASLANNKPADAQAAFERGRSLLETLIKEHPSDPGYRGEWAGTLLDRGILLATIDPAGAERAFRDSLDEFTRLVTDRPQEVLYALERAKAQANLGALLVQMGRAGEALAPLRSAVGQLRELTERAPEQPRVVAELGRATANLGGFLRATGNPAEAEAVFRDAVEKFRPLATQYRRTADYRYQLALAQADLARTLADLRKSPTVERESARQLLAELVNELPDIPEYRRALANVLEDVGMDREAAGERASALEALTEALEHARKLAASDPGNPDDRQGLALRHLNTGILLARDGQHEAAESNYDSAVALFAGPDLPPSSERDAALVAALTNKALLLRRLNRPGEEDRVWKRVLDAQGAAVTRQPTAAGPLATRGQTRYTLAKQAAPERKVELLAGSFADARAALDRAPATDPGRKAVIDLMGRAGLERAETLLDLDRLNDAATALAAFADAVPASWVGTPRAAALLARCATGSASAERLRLALELLVKFRAAGGVLPDDLREAAEFAPLKQPPTAETWQRLWQPGPKRDPQP